MLKKLLTISAVTGTVLFTMTPSTSLACACGCGVFDVGTGAMLPNDEGGRVFAEYSFLNQDKNWHGDSSAPSEDNEDKVIRTKFYTVGAQYMFSRAWGAEVDIPTLDRHVTMENEDTSEIESLDHSAIGDIRIKGIYSGFSEDMSTGVVFGLKLPTGDYKEAGFERDIQIGTGSTDLLLGAYHMGNINGAWNWFGNSQLSLPVATKGEYRPGSELNAAAGVYYNNLNVDDVKISPMAQVVNSYRWHDSGADSSPANSGYELLVLSPGVELNYNDTRFNGSIGIPVYNHVRGNQLVVPALLKISVSYRF